MIVYLDQTATVAWEDIWITVSYSEDSGTQTADGTGWCSSTETIWYPVRPPKDKQKVIKVVFIPVCNRESEKLPEQPEKKNFCAQLEGKLFNRKTKARSPPKDREIREKPEKVKARGVILWITV